MIGTLVGKYKILRPLGTGGMGEVYLGEHIVLKQLRAVKLLLPEYAKHPHIVERFIGEAKAVAALKHDNVIAVDDIGQLDNGICYMVLEYLEGGTLARFIASHGGAISLHVIVHILGQVAYGLQAAHDRNIIHRDLKPENIFLTEGNAMRAVVIDFGVARLAEQLSGGAVTKTGVVVGTPQYMAPEQHRGERVGPAADVYALGVILYEMATGWLPYLDEHARREDYLDLTGSEIYHRQMTRPPFDPRRRFSGLSEPLVELMLATLDRDPARRPASPRAFALKLAERVPTDGYHPDGLEVLRTIAKPLLDIDDLLETVRSAVPAGAASSASAPPATRYQLGKKLGAGGMAEVFMASVGGASGFSRQVAIKRVLPGLSETPAFAEMFVQEARIMSRLNHPNIVGVIAFDKDPEGRLFIVMEYVDGRDLSSLADTGRLPVSVTIFIIIEMLQGLGYAHDFPDPTGEICGIVHRDISPHNVLVGWNGSIKISDFGIAKAFAESGAVRSSTVKGKVQYMSPEQVNAEHLDGRSDLFAVGVVLWELLTGVSLFVGTAREAMAQVLFRDIPLPRSVNPDIPADVEVVAMKLLERARNLRYANAEAAIEDLSRCADTPRNGRRDLARLLAERFPDLACVRSQQRSSDSGVAQLAVPPLPLSSQGNAFAVASTSHRRLWIACGLAIIMIGFGAGIGVVVRHTNRESTAPAVASAHPNAPRAIDAARVAQDPDAPALVATGTPTTDAAVEGAASRDAAPPADASAMPETKKPVGAGTLTVKVIPWGEVTIDRKPYGQTPVRATLGAGRHKVRISNDAADKSESIDVTVEAGKPITIERNWKQ